jgi:hypothetical protein
MGEFIGLQTYVSLRTLNKNVWCIFHTQQDLQNAPLFYAYDVGHLCHPEAFRYKIEKLLLHNQAMVNEERVSNMDAVIHTFRYASWWMIHLKNIPCIELDLFFPVDPHLPLCQNPEWEPHSWTEANYLLDALKKDSSCIALQSNLDRTRFSLEDNHPKRNMSLRFQGWKVWKRKRNCTKRKIIG